MPHPALLASALTLACMAMPAIADEDAKCIPLSGPKGAIIAHDGKWIALTSSQRHFLAGVYAMNPRTPAGLPYGDGAVLAQIPGDKGALIFFVDGDKVCTPMPIPDELIQMLHHLEEVFHEGDKS